jgi:hypothetical protein
MPASPGAVASIFAKSDTSRSKVSSVSPYPPANALSDRIWHVRASGMRTAANNDDAVLNGKMVDKLYYDI